MKILFFNYEYPPLGGGAGNATHYILREYAKVSSLEVDLVTSSVDEEYHLEKIGDNIKIHRLPIGKNMENIHYQSNKELLVYSWRAYWFGRKLIKQNKYDLSLAFFGIPCGFIAMVLGVPYVVSLRGSDVPFYSKRYLLLDLLLFRSLSRIVWKRAEAVVALSHDLVRIARRTSKKQNITVLYNGIDTKEFFPNEDVLDKEDCFNILFVGRLIERKGLIYLLEALKSFSKKVPKTRLFVAGDGPLKGIYEKFVKDNELDDKVIFLGAVKHDDMANLYQKSHVFVLPSLNEALGNVTQEALASGLPIITTDTGAAELIENERNGFIIAKKSSVEILEKLEKLSHDENLRKGMGSRSRELALEMGWEATARKYHELFKGILNKKQK